MQLRWVQTRTGNFIYDEDSGNTLLEELTTLQYRESDDDEWKDVPTVNLTTVPKTN